MNNVTYLKDIKKPKDVRLISIDDVVNTIKDEKRISTTSALRMLYEKSIDQKITPEKREEYRLEYTRLKNTLDNVIFSGEFIERNNNSCSLYWGRVILDIDHIYDSKTLVKVKEYFKSLPYTILMFTSPSGKGLKIVTKVYWQLELPINVFHVQAFNALKSIHDSFLKKFKLEIDPSGKDLARTCFLCYDNKAYYNPDADSNRGFEFSFKKEEEVKPLTIKSYYKRFEEKSNTNNRKLVDDMISFCNDKNIDITKDYNNWLSILFALKHAFGEDGYREFEAFSAISSKYNADECKNKWDTNTIDPNKPIISLGTIVYLCSKYGYVIHKDIKDKEYEWNKLINKLEEENIYLRYETDSNSLQIKRNRWDRFTDLDEDTIRLNTFGGKINKTDITGFLNVISPKVALHEEFIKNLPKWDGIDRYESLADTLICEEEVPLKYTYIKKWCIGFIAQLHNDGFNRKINENMIILTGPQYAGKSNWCNKLLPDEWKTFFATKNIDTTQKDDLILMSEKFIIFMDEGLSLKKNDVRALKTLLSSDTYTGRAAYGKHNQRYVRHCSFIASTNDEQILSDDTGNRRYWIIPIVEANFRHDIDMNQLWAQSLELYNNNEQYWLTIDEYETLKEVNTQYETENSLEEYIKEHVVEGDQFCSATEIKDYILNFVGKHEYVNEYRVGVIMKKLNFKRKQKKINGKPKWGYNIQYNTYMKKVTMLTR